VFLTFFAVAIYGARLTSKPAVENMTVFLWVPLAQFVWTGGWMMSVMRQYIGED
jgi:cytochrome c-type biogenesis protein CcmH/NrfF